MTPQTSTHISPAGTTLLRRSGLIWYLTAAVGQLAFVWMIIAHYGAKTVSGNYPGWNDKPIIKGYVAGDTTGNILFAVHVLLAAVITCAGLLQLVPAIRSRLPTLHRVNGRVFLILAYIMAMGGLWMTWLRPTYLSVMSGVAVSLNGLLILLCASIAWRLAVKRRIDAHRHWAMRTFMVVNGVWFLRVGLMGWVLITHGGAGLTRDMSGPVDLTLAFGSYLIPLVVLELYLRAQRSPSPLHKRLASALVLLMTAFMAIGIGGAVAFMWGPYM